VTRSWKRAVVDVVVIGLTRQTTLTRVVSVSHMSEHKSTVVIITAVRTSTRPEMNVVQFLPQLVELIV